MSSPDVLLSSYPLQLTRTFPPTGRPNCSSMIMGQNADRPFRKIHRRTKTLFHHGKYTSVQTKTTIFHIPREVSAPNNVEQPRGKYIRWINFSTNCSALENRLKKIRRRSEANSYPNGDAVPLKIPAAQERRVYVSVQDECQVSPGQSDLIYRPINHYNFLAGPRKNVPTVASGSRLSRRETLNFLRNGISSSNQAKHWKGGLN